MFSGVGSKRVRFAKGRHAFAGPCIGALPWAFAGMHCGQPVLRLGRR